MVGHNKQTINSCMDYVRVFLAAATAAAAAAVVFRMAVLAVVLTMMLLQVCCSGIVAAFGVPDDAVYDTFEFSKFFRKNINLIASVIPDPDTVSSSVECRLSDERRSSNL